MSILKYDDAIKKLRNLGHVTHLVYFERSRAVTHSHKVSYPGFNRFEINGR